MIPAALALLSWVQSFGYCSPRGCALTLDGERWWLYSRPAHELVLLRSVPGGTLRIVADSKGVPLEGVLVQDGPCTIYPNSPRACPTTIPLEPIRIRKEIENAAFAAKEKLGL